MLLLNFVVLLQIHTKPTFAANFATDSLSDLNHWFVTLYFPCSEEHTSKTTFLTPILTF